MAARSHRVNTAVNRKKKPKKIKKQTNKNEKKKKNTHTQYNTQ